MSERDDTVTSGPTGTSEERRCPDCDTIVPADSSYCLMCGRSMPVAAVAPEQQAAGQQFAAEEAPADAGPVEEAPADAGPVEEAPADEEPAGEEPEVDVPADEEPAGAGPVEEAPSDEESASEEPEVDVPANEEPLAVDPAAAEEVIEARMMERQAPLTLWLTAAFLVLIIFLGSLVLKYPASAEIAFLPTRTPIPPTITFTPTWTPPPSATRPPTLTPTITPTPAPSATPRPPRSHVVAAGETLFGLSLRYGVGADGIAEANDLPPNAGLVVSQELLIPWPTPTPPLQPVAVEIGGETIIADPTGCERYEIQNGDTLFGIAARQRIDLRALTTVNRLTDQSVLQPGDTICIPRIIRDGILPPTPGPSPTPSPTLPPAGPQLLYPLQNALVQPAEGPLVLQWAAVKDLAEDEWYMIELVDLNEVDSHPRRGFTRQNSFRVPLDWRPTIEEVHTFRWRVRIVRVTGQRADGGFIYTFGGSSSQEAFFTWQGAVPTATPTPSPTATAASVE